MGPFSLQHYDRRSFDNATFCNNGLSYPKSIDFLHILTIETLLVSEILYVLLHFQIILVNIFADEMATLSKRVRTALNDCASEPWKWPRPRFLYLFFETVQQQKKLQFRCLKVEARKVCKRVNRKRKGRECRKWKGNVWNVKKCFFCLRKGGEMYL